MAPAAGELAMLDVETLAGGRTRGDAGVRVRQVGDVQGDRAAAEADRHRTASRAPRRTKVIS